VHAAGYCIGGTLLATLLGWLTHDENDHPIADATFFATLLDFSEPGDLRAFVNPASLKAVNHLVGSEGVLRGSHLAIAFRLLNSGDLIWRNMVNSYYCGDTPPRSDMLFWNSDCTNLPGAMCTFYLKSFYLENRLIHPNALVLGQRPIDLKQVRLPLYVVGAAKDHICPWQATFQTCRLTSGTVRYILAGEGHITGIVDPPSQWSKKKYLAGAATRRSNANRWLQGKLPVAGSWWPDWVSWLKTRSGSQAVPPSMGSTTYPPMEIAPGTYVLGQNPKTEGSRI
jgi:polyhydroxyalkanoate synthase subunit PhaC